MALLVFFVLLALVVSFACSIMEAVLLSVTPGYVATLEQNDDPAGPRIRALQTDIDKPLSAILTLNTIAHTVGAAGAGAQAEAVFGGGETHILFEWLTPTMIFAGVLTLLILVLSEIIPKTLGAIYWKPLTGPVATALRGLILVLKPFVWMSQQITKLLSNGEKGSSVSREEFSALAQRGAEEGIFGKDEVALLHNLFRFREVRVQDVMTPRTVVYALPAGQTVTETLEESNGSFRFSRIPIYGENRDDVQGIVLKDEILLAAAYGRGADTLKSIARPPVVVPETLALPDLLERMLAQRHHIAVALDEYGGFAGVVSMEDVIETLLGTEIVDEADANRDMQQLARDQWRRRAERLGLLDDVFPGATTEEALRAASESRPDVIRSEHPDDGLFHAEDGAFHADSRAGALGTTGAAPAEVSPERRSVPDAGDDDDAPPRATKGGDTPPA